MATQLGKPPVMVEMLDPNTGRMPRVWAEWFERLWTMVDALTNGAALTDSTGGTADGTLAAVTETLTDPADSPGTADALRDDLVANMIPELNTALATINDNFADIRQELADARILQ